MIEGQKQYVSKHILLFILLIAGVNVFSQTDSTKKIKVPKHYFTPTIFSDYYTTPQKNLDQRFRKGTEDLAIRKRLENYQYSQLVGGFYFPIITKDYNHTDGSTGNFHLLGTGSYMMAMPRFGGTSDHNLLKASIGIRGIYNSGKKGIWFVDVTPFMSTDLSARSNTVYRWASTVLYDYMANPNLSFRFGVTRTFLLGNRYHLPYFGIRIGRLDKIYISIQFPRNVTFSFPMRRYLRGSVYLKPMGGLFNMANNDSIYPNNKDNTIIYGRYELISGFRLDANLNKHVSFFVSTGFTGVKSLAFYSETEDKKNRLALNDFYKEKISRGLFFNVGFTLRIGRAKSIYNNYNLYETFNLNSTIDVGDNNTNMGDGNIPNQTKSKEKSNLKIKDVQDLIEAQDLY
ncbi:MAG TPA: DUF6268 family outer membrane beta-barrel protein [Bacteroidia bacterium]|nr:DUF6268 family outer membrane beta-barrel protein [Bacteroidia bacterium]